MMGFSLAVHSIMAKSWQKTKLQLVQLELSGYREVCHKNRRNVTAGVHGHNWIKLWIIGQCGHLWCTEPQGVSCLILLAHNVFQKTNKPPLLWISKDANMFSLLWCMHFSCYQKVLGVGHYHWSWYGFIWPLFGELNITKWYLTLQPFFFFAMCSE